MIGRIVKEAAIDHREGTSGLIFNEPLLWERGSKGRTAFSMPKCDVPEAAVDADLVRDDLDLPDLSELEVVRHYTRLSQWNFGVDSGMYPLGSCTMKYNPKINDKLATLPGFARAHPLQDDELSQGVLEMVWNLERFLSAITGLGATSLQPAAGAHGEYAGMQVFAAYHRSQGRQRTKILIPDTAHGTNPASAALCGYTSVGIKIGADGILDPAKVAELMDEDTAGIMITNPNTLGLFESNLKEIADIVHAKGGLLYGDGANMNAILGVADLGRIGVDVLHFNLHKTFSTPHGGGGPGSGPICVAGHLEPFLPVPRVVKDGDMFRVVDECGTALGSLHPFFGQVGVMLRAYCYILSLGADGLRRTSEMAVLNANYIKEKLKDVYELAFDQPCMHEAVFSDGKQKDHGVTTLDIAKRLMDLGYHPPTIYFPLIVHGSIMIEPTESESKQQIDAFIEAMRAIAVEAEQEPELLKASPQRFKVGRLDEVAAARKPVLQG
jgi:glycine dehydrogenase subunit 2